VHSFEAEEHLLFSGASDDGTSLDQEQCEKLFQVAASSHPASMPQLIAERLEQEAALALSAALNRSMEANNTHFVRATHRLEQWAADKLLGEESKLQAVKEQIFTIRRELRAAATLAAQTELQQKLADLEKRQRRLRQSIFDVEDEIAAERDRHIERLRARLSRGHSHETLFTVRWEVV
jgi:predicted  nucleic acid-binding Zn-ribbon protein